MFQSFEVRSDPGNGRPRLAALRAAMAEAGLQGFLVPRADRHQGETVAPCDERLAWLTGFTGSAGLCAALATRAAVFVDGRYTLQLRRQVDTELFEPVAIHQTRPEEWLAAAMRRGEVLGFDPWLHGRDEIDRLTARLEPLGVELRPVDNLVDRVWTDRPPPPAAPARIHPLELAGESHHDKRTRLAAGLADAGIDAAVLTLTDSIAWLLNSRGSDIPRMPVVQAFALLHADARVMLFSDTGRFGPELRAHLGADVTLRPWADFEPALADLGGRVVALDRATAPVRVQMVLERAGARLRWQRDPCILPKACKNAVELAGIRAAHLRDGAAMVRFLHWLDGALAGLPEKPLTEIDVVRALEGFRAATGRLRDISFETICGAGPNGAIVHYRVDEASNRAITPGDLLLVDSGGQYEDGTTDITRTMATGPVPPGARRAFTLVLKGMIAISTARFPPGIAGRDLDSLARIALWRAGLDYDHGTGHGVGAYLGVHEGPAAIARRSLEELRPGMVLSNEPGYYREGAFGIRIENLVAIRPAEPPEGGDRPMLSFETLTLCPIDRRLIDPALLDAAEGAWLDSYHAHVAAALAPLLPPETAAWLRAACAPLAAGAGGAGEDR
ncbi:MAG: aminopeptidase P family protein [Alphaproteobacteria bacterium]|nr:MAG: aminopeptidase P family protein [Alphaproteobacteria bacterium]